MKRRESKYFCISDIRYSRSFEYHLQIILNKELFKVRDLVAIEDLIEYFGGKCKEGFSSELLYIIKNFFALFIAQNCPLKHTLLNSFFIFPFLFTILALYIV